MPTIGNAGSTATTTTTTITTTTITTTVVPVRPARHHYTQLHVVDGHALARYERVRCTEEWCKKRV
jgi:hypothetical protein